MARSDSPANETRNRAPWFALMQVVLIPTIAFAALRSNEATHLRLQPALSNVPRVVGPLYNYPLVISDTQLHATLEKLRPPRVGSRPKINHVDHALRFWGSEASFRDDQVMSGPSMTAALMRDDAFREVSGEGARPLLLNTRDGWRFRTQEGAATSSHVDHTLATLAEVGVNLERRLLVRDGDAIRQVPMAEVVVDAMRRFGINQQEYEWTALVLGLYGTDFSTWQSSEGERITMDRIAQRIMRQDYGQGCCYGGHRLFTLTSLFRIDEQESFFSAAVRQSVHDHLSEATSRLVSSQSPAGFWGNDWPGETIGTDSAIGELGQRLLTTGHALEWWAIAPASCQPPRESVIRAAQWMVTEVEKMDTPTVAKNYTFLTHAGRALALWRGDFPAAHWARLQQNRGVDAAVSVKQSSRNEAQK